MGGETLFDTINEFDKLRAINCQESRVTFKNLINFIATRFNPKVFSYFGNVNFQASVLGPSAVL